MSDRPKWDFNVDEKLFRWLASKRVIEIKHKWKMITAEAGAYWIELHAKDGSCIETHELPEDFFVFRPNSIGLIELTQKGRQARQCMAKIDEWKIKNEKDRIEYERLKQKFGD